MMLTTPAMASEPYAADAPPVTVSTRWIMIDGIRLRSTWPPSDVGMKRRVLTRVSVRVPKVGFRPRKLAYCEPALADRLVPDVASDCDAIFCGIRRMTSAALVWARFLIRLASTTVTGTGELKPSFLIRDPVTTMLASSAVT